ncbi:MAG: aminopeptidase P family protein [Muribaculaceae bacterium]|nr:aminopeptidase P family protein [Muribaculaceae bacterium]
MNSLVLLTADEQQLRLQRLRTLMADAKTDAILITDNANTYYLTGRVFSGYIYIPVEGKVRYMVRRPVELEGDGVEYIRKPEDIIEKLDTPPSRLGLELDLTPYSLAMRIVKTFPGHTTVNISPLMRVARSVKTAQEQEKMRMSGVKHEHVYRMVPHLYTEGMTDLELQVEIERLSRLEGCLGQFRISGDSMELYMGNLLAGDNADNPTPYDFAMGGAGIDPSLPVGADGSVIRPGNSVMVDMNGNFTGYMTDMTRTFALGEISAEARKAHQLSIDICREVSRHAVPGTEAKALYELAEKMVAEAGMERYFMGHRQKAGFIGHGVGIEVNELPVVAPRSKDIIAEGNAIAIEPKFVIPGTGAVGIENTYLVGAGGATSITNAPQEIVSLD